jgi:glycosyltransferase involved in cell wall biosynthesis
MMPRVTALISAYNNAGTLERAARSMLDQTVDELELILIDDGSSDDSAAVATRIAEDPRVRVIGMDRNVGIAGALNAGVEAAAAPIVAVLDADDWADRRRLERQLAVLDRDPAIAVVGSRMREVDPSGRELAPRTSFAAGEVGDVLMRFNPIPNTSAAFRRDAVLAVGGYDPRYRWATEYDLWLRVAERHKLYAIDEPLSTREMSLTNVAATRERAQTAEAITMRVRAMRRRRSLRGATGLLPYAISYVTPSALKRARRRRLGQAP